MTRAMCTIFTVESVNNEVGTGFIWRWVELRVGDAGTLEFGMLSIGAQLDVGQYNDSRIVRDWSSATLPVSLSLILVVSTLILSSFTSAFAFLPSLFGLDAIIIIAIITAQRTRII